MRILNFGPKRISVGEKFNLQSNGKSALWFEIEDINDHSNIVICFDGHILKSARLDNIVSVSIPTKFLEIEKNILIEIFDEKDPFKKEKLIFEIFLPETNGSFEFVKKTNLFIIGAPRSGTTTLYWRLSAHPNIYMSRIKEPYYFDERAYDFLTPSIQTENDYASLFKYAHYDAKIIGEASVTYLSSLIAMKKVTQFNPDAKIIVMLRNPIVSSISFYLMHKKGKKYEFIETFKEAWGNSLSNINRTFINNYTEIFKIGDQLEEAQQIFAHNLKVVFYDDLEIDSAKMVRDILEFLELPLDSDYPLEKTNSAEWNDIHSIVSEELLLEMKDYFRPQIEKVSHLTGRDLSHWLNI